MHDFFCDKCGLCCQNLNRNPIYKNLDDGTGVCKHYDRETRMCLIYNSRPLICNVKLGYELFADKLTYEEYLKMNYDMCKILKEGK